MLSLLLTGIKAIQNKKVHQCACHVHGTTACACLSLFPIVRVDENLKNTHIINDVERLS